MIGRHTAEQTITNLLRRVDSGLSGSLVIRGEPGIGKSTLLEYAKRAGGFHVVDVVGVASERHLGFAALHRLLLPLRAFLDRLPERQRDAVHAAFGSGSAPGPDVVLVGLAALTVLGEAAQEQPMLCLIDDCHWIDHESLDVLGFVARRLHAERIAMMFATRDLEHSDHLDGLSELRLVGLDRFGTQQLLDDHGLRLVDPDALDAVVARTGGNPLAIITCAQALNARRIAGWVDVPDPLPIDADLHDYFTRQIDGFPDDTRRLLLTIAAEPGIDVAGLWQVGREVGFVPESATPAELADLLRLDRTPTAYHRAPSAERRAIHRALARLAEVIGDPDRVATHLAASATEPDKAIAMAVEEVARRARRRGAAASASANLARAAELTPDLAVRARRFVEAAQAAVDVGDAATARELLERARALPSTSQVTDHADRIAALTMAIPAVGDLARAPGNLLASAEACWEHEPAVGRDMLAAALNAAQLARSYIAGTTWEAIASTALTLLNDEPEPRSPASLLAEGCALRVTAGFDASVPTLRNALQTLAAEDGLPDGHPNWALLAIYASRDLWDDTTLQHLLSELETSARDRGEIDALRSTLYMRAEYERAAGRFRTAADLIDEARELADAIGAAGGTPGMWEALLWAWQGDERAGPAADAVLDGFARQLGFGALEAMARRARLILDLGAGRYARALEHARADFIEDAPDGGNSILADVVEAAVRSGDLTTAETAVRRLDERARASRTPWALGLRSRALGLVAGDDAEADLRTSIEHLSVTSIRTELARSHLVYGEWLRRQRRRSDAREQLRRSHELFSEMGAQLFAERARVELLATGETARRREPGADQELTPQERRAATLAAGGATNPEIAAELFISASTVEYHLRKVYRKLGITSRRQLPGSAFLDVPTRDGLEGAPQST
jgi:DNA-binding CsgD family transcriptional regulator